MNIVVDALSLIHEVNVLNFIEINIDIYEQLQGKCLDEKYFGKLWVGAKSGIDAINISSLKGTFYILNGLLYRNGNVCAPNFLEA